MENDNKLQKFTIFTKNLLRKHPYACTAALCLAVSLFCCESPIPFLAAPRWWMVVALPLLLGIGSGYFIIKKQLHDRIAALLLMGAGFCLRFAYVLATPYYSRQHDVGEFSGDSGHAAYITYLYEHLQLPDFDVREVWQFYHPPLHHSIAAGWMRLLTSCGIPFEQAGEHVQLLTLTYSCLCMVLFYKLLRHFHLKGMALCVPLAILAFHPTFLILSGSINNDMLSITFMLASVLLTLRWYREPKLSTILKLALTIGLGMLTKLSAWMVAPAAATAFLVILYRNRKQAPIYLKQFVLFGVICVPLGLGWGIRNLIRWGVPIAYVPKLSANSAQFVGDLPIRQRLFDFFSPQQWTYMYDCFTMYGQSYDEYNPLIGLFKTAMFDELINPERFPAISGFGETLYLSQIVLVILSVIALVTVLRRNQIHADGAEKCQLCLTYGITLISYYSFCIGFPHVCTQNIRYATPLIFIGCLFLGLFLQHPKTHRILRYGISLVTCVFACMSWIVYFSVCR